MSDLLTQEEINALLNAGIAGSDDGGAGEAPPPPPPSGGGSGSSSSFSQEAIDKLSEVAKLSLGATSSVVQVLLNKEIEINLEQVRVVNFSELASEGGGEEFVLAKIAYVEGFDGNSYLMLKKTISALIGDLMMGGEGLNAEFQDMHTSAVGEMMNQMMGKTTTSLSEIFKKRVDISPPEVVLVNFTDGPPPMPDFSPSSLFLRIGYNLKIGDLAETEMVQLLPAAFAELMAAELNKPQKEPEKKAKPAPPPPGAGLQPQSPPPGAMPGLPPQMPEWVCRNKCGNGHARTDAGNGYARTDAGMGCQGRCLEWVCRNDAWNGYARADAGNGHAGMMPGMGMPGQMQGSPAEFGMLQMPMGMGLQSNIDLLLDVPLQITVELGRTRMLIKDVLELGIGSVVELNKLAGESVEVFVNNKLIAKGEVVVIDENFAVRITSIINPQDRLHAL